MKIQKKKKVNKDLWQSFLYVKLEHQEEKEHSNVWRENSLEFSKTEENYPATDLKAL